MTLDFSCFIVLTRHFSMHLGVDNILKVSFHQQVETIGDAYVVASGKRCEKKCFSLEVLLLKYY